MISLPRAWRTGEGETKQGSLVADYQGRWTVTSLSFASFTVLTLAHSQRGQRKRGQRNRDGGIEFVAPQTRRYRRRGTRSSVTLESEIVLSMTRPLSSVWGY
jgi:hypothetical protein